MFGFRTFSFAIFSVFVLTTQAPADIVKMPGQQAEVVVEQSNPMRGMTKQQVEARFGTPSSRQGPVGEPAIYRWDYAGYSVFFEHNYVLHSVVHTQ